MVVNSLLWSPIRPLVAPLCQTRKYSKTRFEFSYIYTFVAAHGPDHAIWAVGRKKREATGKFETSFPVASRLA